MRFTFKVLVPAFCVAFTALPVTHSQTDFQKVISRSDTVRAEPVNLSNHGGGDYEPAWSPDGRRIAFYSDRNPYADRGWEIYTMNANGSGQSRSANTNLDFRPTWSPDGKKLAFDSFRDGNHEIYIMNSDGSDQHRLTTDKAYDSAPHWSHDGAKIVYFSGPKGLGGIYPYGNSDVWVMNSDGSNKTRLTNTELDDAYPRWSLDGKRIVFTSYRDGNGEIYIMNADGSEQSRLTKNSARDDDARWSPDGQKIVFATNRDGNFEVYVMSADGSGQTNLTRHSALDRYPAWSPDNKKISFSSKRDGNYEIYVMDVVTAKQNKRVAVRHAGDEEWLGHNAMIWLYENGDASIVLSNAGAIDGRGQSAIVGRGLDKLLRR